MFFPERMVRVEISIPEEYLYQTIEAIGESGLLHVDKKGEKPMFQELHIRVWKLLDTVEGYLESLDIPLPRPLLKKKEVADYEQFLSEAEKFVSSAAPVIEALANRHKRLREETASFERAKSFAQVLGEEIDLLQIAEKVKYIGVKAIVLAKESLEMFMVALKRYDPFIVHAPFASGSVAVLLFYDRLDEAHMLNVISKMEGVEIARDYFLKEKIDEIEQMKQEMDRDFKKTAERYANELLDIYMKLKRGVKLLAIRGALHKSADRYFLYGWLPKREAKRFRDALKYADVVFFKAGDDAPVLLKTPKILKSFEVLIKNFSYPGYNEINPTVPFAFAFLIMFGAMFGDIGHGAILMAAGFIVSRKFKKYEDLGRVYILAGIGSFIFGFFYGSFFGFHDVVPHLLFIPVENVNLSIFTGIAIGIFFITIGFLLNIVSLSRRKKISALFMGEGGVLWLLIYWFAIGIAAKALIFELPVRYELYFLSALIALLLIILLIRKREYTQTLLDTVIQMFEQAVNTISFARLGAFALAHGALFLALFSVADILSKTGGRGVWYWFIIVLGNCFIIVLEGVVVTIQTLRLEYYEFFKHFFKGGGKPYKPFVLENE